MTLGTRIGIGVVGVVMLLFGWAARSFQQESSSLGFVVIAAPDGVVGAYRPDDSLEGPFEIQEAGDDGFSVVRNGEALFTGTEAEAAFWIETKGAEPAFTGTTAEVEAWVADQNAAEDDFFWSYVLMISGGVVLLGAIGLGRGRT